MKTKIARCNVTEPDGDTVRDFLINHERLHTEMINCNAKNGYVK